MPSGVQAARVYPQSPQPWPPHFAASVVHFAEAGIHDADELSRTVLKDFKLLE